MTVHDRNPTLLRYNLHSVRKVGGGHIWDPQSRFWGYLSPILTTLQPGLYTQFQRATSFRECNNLSVDFLHAVQALIFEPNINTESQTILVPAGILCGTLNFYYWWSTTRGKISNNKTRKLTIRQEKMSGNRTRL